MDIESIKSILDLLQANMLPFVVGLFVGWLGSNYLNGERIKGFNERLERHKEEIGFLKDSHERAVGDARKLEAELNKATAELERVKAGQSDTGRVLVIIDEAHERLRALQEANTVVSSTLDELPKKLEAETGRFRIGWHST
jgi:chromosome segregation ATPase